MLDDDLQLTLTLSGFLSFDIYIYFLSKREEIILKKSKHKRKYVINVRDISQLFYTYYIHIKKCTDVYLKQRKIFIEPLFLLNKLVKS